MRIARPLVYVIALATSLAATPSAAFDNPIIAFDNPIIAFDNPIIAFDNPIIAVKKPLVGKTGVVSFDNPIIAQELALMTMDASLARLEGKALSIQASKAMSYRFLADVSAAKTRNASLLQALPMKAPNAIALRNLAPLLDGLHTAGKTGFTSPDAIKALRGKVAHARKALAGQAGAKDAVRARLALQVIELQRMHTLLNQKGKCTTCWPAALPSFSGHDAAQPHFSAANAARMKGIKAMMGTDTGFPDVCREAIEAAIKEIAAGSAKL